MSKHLKKFSAIMKFWTRGTNFDRFIDPWKRRKTGLQFFLSILKTFKKKVIRYMRMKFICVETTEKVVQVYEFVNLWSRFWQGYWAFKNDQIFLKNFKIFFNQLLKIAKKNPNQPISLEITICVEFTKSSVHLWIFKSVKFRHPRLQW